jgi:hypothetical protein
VTPIIAEVLEKEPTLMAIWLCSGFLCILTFILAQTRRWGILLSLFVAGISVFATLSWLRDPNEGPAIIKELGRKYVTQAYVAGFLPCLVVALCFLAKHLRIRRHPRT